MALQKSFNTKFGFNADKAYLVIESVNVNKLRNFLAIRVAVYKDNEAKRNNKQNIEVIEKVIRTKQDYDTIVNGGNILESCYNYIKTLPEFEGSTDV